MTTNRFNIRVYGLLFHPEKGLLISHEHYQGHSFTKFPGGGLEWGEGPAEAIRRELMEELEIHVASIEHFYTTDFFVQSAFRETDQVVSIYYKVTPLDWAELDGASERKNTGGPGRSETFEWVTLENLSIENVQFPTDRCVMDLLLRSGF